MYWHFLKQDWLNSNNGQKWQYEVSYSPAHTIVPQSMHVFKAIELTPYEKVQNVVVGTRPYLQFYEFVPKFLNQSYSLPLADGLAFSITAPIPIHSMPASHNRVYQELQRYESFLPHNFSFLAQQRGYLFLNLALTASIYDPLAHLPLWTDLTLRILQSLNHHYNNLQIILVGSIPISYKNIFNKRHKIILLEE